VNTLFLRASFVVLLAFGMALAAKPEYVVMRDCITGVSLKADATCHGPDLENMVCSGFILTMKKNCEVLKVK
jgi:hypothetical protein